MVHTTLHAAVADKADPLGWRGGHRGGAYSLLVAATYAVTHVGAAGDRMFGSLDRLRFGGPLLFAVALLAVRSLHEAHVGRLGSVSLALAVVGSALVGVGSFGGSWLNFPRSGNYVSFPGNVVLHVGLLMFGGRPSGRR